MLLLLWPYRYFGKFVDFIGKSVNSSSYKPENTFNILEIKYFRAVTF